MTVTLLPKALNRCRGWLFILVMLIGFFGLLFLIEQLEATKRISYTDAFTVLFVITTAMLFLALAYAIVIRAWKTLIASLCVYFATVLIVPKFWPAWQVRGVLTTFTFAILLVTSMLILKPQKTANTQ